MSGLVDSAIYPTKYIQSLASSGTDNARADGIEADIAPNAFSVGDHSQALAILVGDPEHPTGLC